MLKFIWLDIDSSLQTNCSNWLYNSCDLTLTRQSNDSILTRQEKIFRWIWLYSNSKDLWLWLDKYDSGTWLTYALPLAHNTIIVDSWHFKKFKAIPISSIDKRSSFIPQKRNDYQFFFRQTQGPYRKWTQDHNNTKMVSHSAFQSKCYRYADNTARWQTLKQHTSYNCIHSSSNSNLAMEKKLKAF